MWKTREEVLEVPAMAKNYYTHVYESKDVSKVMSHMPNSFQSTKNVSEMLVIPVELQDLKINDNHKIHFCSTES